MLTPPQRETLDEIPTRDLISYVALRTPALVTAFYLPSNDPDSPLVCFMHGALANCIALASCLQHKTVTAAQTYHPD